MRGHFLLLIFLFTLSCKNQGRVEEHKSVGEKSDDPAQLFEYELPKFGIGIKLPVDWSIEELDERSYYLKMKIDTATVFRTNIIIRLVSDQKGPIEGYARLFAQALENRYDTCELVGITNAEYGEFDVGIVDFTIVEEGMKLKGTTALFNKDNYVLNMGLMSVSDKAYDNYREVLLSIVGSVRRIE